MCLTFPLGPNLSTLVPSILPEPNLNPKTVSHKFGSGACTRHDFALPVIRADGGPGARLVWCFSASARPTLFKLPLCQQFEQGGLERQHTASECRFLHRAYYKQRQVVRQADLLNLAFNFKISTLETLVAHSEFSFARDNPLNLSRTKGRRVSRHPPQAMADGVCDVKVLVKQHST